MTALIFVMYTVHYNIDHCCSPEMKTLIVIMYTSLYIYTNVMLNFSAVEWGVSKFEVFIFISLAFLFN